MTDVIGKVKLIHGVHLLIALGLARIVICCLQAACGSLAVKEPWVANLCSRDSVSGSFRRLGG